MSESTLDSQSASLSMKFQRFTSRLHGLNVSFCLGLLSVLFLAQISVVVLRYFFKIGFVELQDLVAYSFAVFCILAIPLSIRTDDHVRVDIFRTKQSETTTRRIDVFSIFAFLLPVFLITLWYSLPLVGYSWSIFEGSRETGGLPGYFLVLTALPVTCVLVVLQGITIYLDPNLLKNKGKL